MVSGVAGMAAGGAAGSWAGWSEWYARRPERVGRGTIGRSHGEIRNRVLWCLRVRTGSAPCEGQVLPGRWCRDRADQELGRRVRDHPRRRAGLFEEGDRSISGVEGSRVDRRTSLNMNRTRAPAGARVPGRSIGANRSARLPFADRPLLPALSRPGVPAGREHRVHYAFDPVRVDADIDKARSAHASQLAHGPTAVDPVANPSHQTRGGTLAACEGGLGDWPQPRTSNGVCRIPAGYDVPGRSGRCLRTDDGGEKTARAELAGSGRCHDRFPRNKVSSGHHVDGMTGLKIGSRSLMDNA